MTLRVEFATQRFTAYALLETFGRPTREHYFVSRYNDGRAVRVWCWPLYFGWARL